TAVTAGKVRSVGISNCYAWQLAKANALAEREGLTPFVSVQSHYNLIMREDERELFGLSTEDNIAMTPYSALASGRLSRKEGYTRRA
ncbi:aldo/keto reductase, partial [Escherichia coli]|nr:aldo/keto reductase [Escherichia coli]